MPILSMHARLGAILILVTMAGGGCSPTANAPATSTNTVATPAPAPTPSIAALLTPVAHTGCEAKLRDAAGTASQLYGLLVDEQDPLPLITELVECMGIR